MNARRGRPGGRTPRGRATSDAILAAARRVFAQRGFDATTIRAVAEAAAVDPALVLHYHGSKQRLFLAATELPVDAARLVPLLLEGPREEVGERLVRFALALWEGDAREALLAVLRSGVSDPVAAALLRDVVTARLLGPVGRAIAADHAELRVSLVASQIVGLALVRYVLAVEPLASASHDAVVAALGPTIQRYLTAPLDPVAREGP